MKTLYLESDIPTRLEKNPFYYKILESKSKVAILSSKKSQLLGLYFKTSGKEELIQRQITDKEFIGSAEITEDTSLFIDNFDDTLSKEFMVQILNSYENVYLGVRYIDWIEKSNFSLTQSFDQLLVSDGCIGFNKELKKFTNVFPNAIQGVQDWIAHPRDIEGTIFYIFNNKPTKAFPSFLILDSSTKKILNLTELKDDGPSNEGKILEELSRLSQSIKDLEALFLDKEGLLEDKKTIKDDFERVTVADILGDDIFEKEDED
jgi:hypothetical protein